MSEVKEKKLLFINMEYTQDEINEPINIDILLGCFPCELFNQSNVTVIYRDLYPVQALEIDQYDIILFSTKISSYPELSVLLASCTQKIVIVGGILAICAADALASRYPNVVFNTGEGETNLISLLRLAHSSKSSVHFKEAIVDNQISNVCFYYEQTNKIYFARRIAKNLTQEEYVQHNKLEDIIAKDGLVRMETSRGCPWNKCSFCIMPWKYCGEAWRPFPRRKIEEELQYLVKHGATQILFTDEDFVGTYEHISTLCDVIEENHFTYQRTLSFGGSTSVMTLLKLGKNLDNCLKRMHNVGISRIFIGIESGCDSQLLRYNKGVTASINEEIIRKLQLYNFEIDFGFILFDADTTMHELEDNLNFIARTGLKKCISRFAKKLRITPHTRFWDEYKARGIITSELNINELFFEYKFCDPTIELICSFVQKLDEQILRESYHLQAIIRSAASQEEKRIAQKRLMTLRECGYIFLSECVNEYKEKGGLCQEKVCSLYLNAFVKGGSVTCE